MQKEFESSEELEHLWKRRSSIEEKRLREEQMKMSVKLICTVNDIVLERERRIKKLREWQIHTSCRNIPDFVRLNDVNEYLSYWADQMVDFENRGTMEKVLQHIPDILQLVNEMRSALEAPPDFCSASACHEIGLLIHSFREKQDEFIDLATYNILRNLKDLYDPELGFFVNVVQTSQIIHAIWGNMVASPQHLGHFFSECNFRFKIPVHLSQFSGIYRVVKLNYDPYSDSSQSYFPPGIPGNPLQKSIQDWIQKKMENLRKQVPESGPPPDQEEIKVVNQREESKITEEEDVKGIIQQDITAGKGEEDERSFYSDFEGEYSSADYTDEEMPLKEEEDEKDAVGMKNGEEKVEKLDDGGDVGVKEESTCSQKNGEEISSERLPVKDAAEIDEDYEQAAGDVKLIAENESLKKRSMRRRRRRRNAEGESNEKNCHLPSLNQRESEEGKDIDAGREEKEPSDKRRSKRVEIADVPIVDDEGKKVEEEGGQTRAEAKGHRKKDKEKEKERPKTESEKAKERERAEKAQFIPRTGPEELNLRNYFVQGGVYNFRFLQIPPQERARGTWIIQQGEETRRLIDYHFVAEYQSPPPPELQEAKKTPEEMEKEAKRAEEELLKLIQIDLGLSNICCWFEPPIPVRWNEEEKVWSQDGFHDVKFNENTLQLGIRTDRFGIFGFAHNRWANLPYQSWELRPKGLNKAQFNLIAAMAVVEFMIKDDLICVSSLQNVSNAKIVEKQLVNKYMKPSALINKLRQHGLDVFPEFDSYAYVDGILIKDIDTENHLYQCMAFSACAFNYHWSRWNLLAGRTKMVYQARERIGTSTPGNYSMFLTTPVKTSSISCTEVSPNYSEDEVNPDEFNADLLHLIYPKMASWEAQAILMSTNPLFIESLYILLSHTKQSWKKYKKEHISLHIIAATDPDWDLPHRL